MTEKEKMLSGKIYDCMEPELNKRRIEVNELCIKYNSLPQRHPDRQELFKKIFPTLMKALMFVGLFLSIMELIPKLVRIVILIST